MIGEHCSAKEVVMAVQEFVETLEQGLLSEDEDSQEQSSIAQQVNRVLCLYSAGECIEMHLNTYKLKYQSYTQAT